MAIIYSYPQIGELATGDTIAISDASNGNKTKSVTIGQLDSYINTGQATIVQVDDRVVTGASFNTNNGILTLTRNGGEIPSVSTNLDGRYALTSSLATVATSGSYNDLSDKPTIPPAYTNADVDAHLNISTAGNNEVLSWTGSDYDWVAQSGGGGGGGTVTEINTTAPITGGPITTTGSIGISQASASTDGYLSSTDWNTFNNKQSTSEKGAASGYAPLDANQKVPSANLPDSLVGAVVYQGTWNALTNIPTLPTPAAGNNGHYYIVSDAGTYLGITYAIGDWAISNGIAWQKVDNTQDVNSVFGRQGSVVANANDYAAFYDANVQSNWTETNNASDAFILNKPTTITQAQSNEIATNTLKTSFPGFGTTAGTALEGNTNLGVVQTLTTTGTSGAATLVGGTLNIPQYSGGGAVDSVNGQTGTVVLATSDLANDSGYIEGTTTTQTAITEIKTLTSTEYAGITPAANVMYVIV
jgi:hypothetical protein